MIDFTPEVVILCAATLAGLLIGGSLLVNILTVVSLRTAAKERQLINRELFGLVKKIEGLTASRREQILKHYDGLLEVLSNKLPAAVATHTSQIIFDAEAKILTRLAELEPNLNSDEKGKQKLDELIRSMEGLEKTIVNLTSDAVRHVMVDGRRALFETNGDIDLSLQ